MSQNFQSDNFRVPRRVSIGARRTTCRTAVAALASTAFSFVPAAPLATLTLGLLGARATSRDATLRGGNLARAALVIGAVALLAQAAALTVGVARHQHVTAAIEAATASGADGDVTAFASAFAAADPLVTADTREKMLRSFFRLLELRYGSFQSIEPVGGAAAALNPPAAGVPYRLTFSREAVNARVVFETDPGAVPHFLRATRFEVIDGNTARIVYPPPARVAASR